MTPPPSRGIGGRLARAGERLSIELAHLGLDAFCLGFDILICRTVGHEIVWRQTTIGRRPFCGRCGSQLR